MSFAVLSDIHANLEALEAVLEAAFRRGVDKWFCLGDIVGYGADPAPCVERTRAAAAQVVLGNHDAAVAERTDSRTLNPYARAAVEWTTANLGALDLEYLHGLPLSASVPAGLLVHADPRQPAAWNYITGAASAAGALASIKARCCWIGHTHQPGLWSVPDQDTARVAAQSWPPTGEGTVPLPAGQRHLINPGSVGQPRDGDPRGCFVVSDDEATELEFIRVAYDVASAQRKIREAGLPELLADRLGYGR